MSVRLSIGALTSSILVRGVCGRVAQLGEHLDGIEGVSGSIPLVSNGRFMVVLA